MIKFKELSDQEYLDLKDIVFNDIIFCDKFKNLDRNIYYRISDQEISRFNVYRKHIIREYQDYYHYILNKYGNNFKISAICDILDQFVIVVRIKDNYLEFIDYGKYTINRYLNPYMDQDDIIFLNYITEKLL